MAIAVPLVDHDGVLAHLARSVTPYPDALRRAMLAGLWQVDFLLSGAEKGARGGDAAYVTLCVTHAVTLLAYGWHAAAGHWVINEKGVVPGVDLLPGAPVGFGGEVARLLGALGVTPGGLLAGIAAARALPRPALA